MLYRLWPFSKTLQLISVIVLSGEPSNTYSQVHEKLRVLTGGTRFSGKCWLINGFALLKVSFYWRGVQGQEPGNMISSLSHKFPSIRSISQAECLSLRFADSILFKECLLNHPNGQ